MKKLTLLGSIGVGTTLVFPALGQDTPRIFDKTPDGVAYLIQAGDPVLAPVPVQSKITFNGKPDPAVLQAAAQWMDDALTALSQKTDDKDLQWYENGVWHNSSEKVWQVQSGPALGAAMLWKWRQNKGLNVSAADKEKQAWLLKVTTETFDRHIKDHQNVDGGMDEVGTHPHFFITDLGLAYLTLGDAMDEATKMRWRNALVNAVEFYIRRGDLPDSTKPGWKATDGWYVNGNVEIYDAEMVHLAWKITGAQKYKDLYETQWKHTMLPSQVRWKGYGLFILKEPTRADGSDGAGYITEAEPEPGFDPEYGQFQLSVLSRLYLQTGDPRVLRTMNLLLNGLLPRVDEKTWMLNATYGSRHSTRLPFSTCGMAVTAWFGQRADLVPKVAAQLEVGMKPTYLKNAQTNQGAPGLYRGYGVDVAVILQAAIAAGS